MSATASGRDRVPYDESNLQTQMCVITLTKWDGTPFDVTSLQEEDIMEICIWLGHAHPLGMLHYTTSESIVLFHSAKEMQWATHGAIKATELCKEAIVIRATALPQPTSGLIQQWWQANS